MTLRGVSADDDELALFQCGPRQSINEANVAFSHRVLLFGHFFPRIILLAARLALYSVLRGQWVTQWSEFGTSLALRLANLSNVDHLTCKQ